MSDNKKMKTLGGYEIVDEKAREDIQVVEEKADEALSLAKGATKAFVYDTYSDMIAELNALDKAELLVNFHVMIRTVCVPDLWISGVSDEHFEYTYISNEDFISDLTEDGVVQVGYFVLSALETQKVELDEYVKKDDFATQNKVGVVYAHNSRGISVLNDGGLIISPANSNSVDSRSAYSPITGKNLDYAVMKALSDSKLEWTEEQKQLARTLLDAIGSKDYATDDKVGLVKGGGNCGTYIHSSSGTICIDKANKSEIDGKADKYKPVVSSLLDYAVKKALSDCKLSGDDVWTDEEKAKALELLGGLQKVTSKYTYSRVYGLDGDGNDKMFPLISGGDASNSVPLRVNGTFMIGSPTNDKHPTTKKYVDDLVGSVETILTELHTYAESLIGGDA